MKRQGLFFVLGTAMISGISIFINKFGVKGIDAYLFTGAKNIIVAIFLFSLILLAMDFKKLRALSKKDYAKLFLIGLFGGSIPFLLFFKGLQLTSAAQGAFIHKTMFLWVGILALIFLKEKLNKGILIGAVLLLAGNFLLLKLNNFVFATGDILILAATLFWSIETIISKHALKTLDSKVVAFGRMFFGSLLIIVFLGVTGKLVLITTLTSTHFLWILITSIFLLGYVFTWYSGLKHIKASVATSILLFGSVITTVLNLVFADVVIVPSQIIGMILLIAGITCVVWFSEIIKKLQKLYLVKTKNY
ncbi:DMT family transporter [Candidatus Woesearchaeota archaeon]|nr:DMT family transporter [Candidatus Woesearchaeota archaeon]